MKKVNHKKELFIISGCTGSIGEAFFIHYLLNKKDCLIYGISRKGIRINRFKNLPQYNSIINFNITSKLEVSNFTKKLTKNTFKTITYIHLLGEFKTEIDSKHLKYRITNDRDNDGIDDDVNNLVYNSFTLMVKGLLTFCKKKNVRLNIIQIGSLADKYKLKCFQSWWKAKNKTLTFIAPLVKKNRLLNHYLLNVSTVLSTKEFIDRPHVFVTEANPKFWLSPDKLVAEATKLVSRKTGMVEKDIYITNPNFSHNYFSEEHTYERRIRELFDKNL